MQGVSKSCIQLHGHVLFYNMVINSTNEIVFHNVLSILILGHLIRLDFCFHGQIVHHSIMNAYKNSFEEETQNCQILQNQSYIFWSFTKPDPFFYHNIARLSHIPNIQPKIATEDSCFQNFKYKTFIHCLASEIIICLRLLHYLSTLELC